MVPSTSQALPDLSRDPWGDPTGTPPPPPVSNDPFVVRPIEATMKLPAVGDAARATRIRWAIASALVVLALGGGWLARELMHEAPVEGTLEIVSRPPGARVVLDGRELPGRTPVTGIAHLPVGRALSLEVLLEEHEPWRGEVTPVAGTLQKVAVLVPLRRDVVVDSSPPGGQVWIDGVLHGALPRRLEDLAHGRTLELRVSWPRGPTVQRSLRVDSSTPERLVIEAP